MMVFLLFNEDVNFRGRKRVQLDIQQALIQSLVEIYGADKRPRNKAQAVFLCAVREFWRSAKRIV